MNWNGVDSEIDSILKLGAKAVITPKFGSGMLVITDEMALAIGETGGIAYGTKGQLFVGPHKVKPYIANETVKVNVAVGEEKAESRLLCGQSKRYLPKKLAHLCSNVPIMTM